MNKKLINSQLCNINTYQMYKRRLLSLAENVFEFENLPLYIDLSYLNKTLLYNGSIAFFKDPVLGLIALPYSIIGDLDIYGRPQEIMARAFNGRYFKKLKSDEFVIMYDNTSRTPIYQDILQIAERIALCKRTIDINIVQQRTPRIWRTSKDKKKTISDLVNNVDSMVENVVAYDSLDVEDLNIILQPAPYVTDKIDLHLDKEWSEFYQLVGIANLQEQKKERVIVDEMKATQGGTIASRYTRYESRKKACIEIKEKFGVDIKVRYYDGIPSTLESDNISDSEVFINDNVSL